MSPIFGRPAADEQAPPADEPAGNGAPAEPDAPVATGAPGSSSASGVSYAYADSGADGAPSVAAQPGAADAASASPGESGGGLDGPLLADVAGLRASWQRIQADFVDDPGEAVSDAADLVEHTAQALVGALRQRQRRLRAMWDPSGSVNGLWSSAIAAPASAEPAAAGQPPADEVPDTEQLRLMMQRYRAFFNEVCRP